MVKVRFDRTRVIVVDLQLRGKLSVREGFDMPAPPCTSWETIVAASWQALEVVSEPEDTDYSQNYQPPDRLCISPFPNVGRLRSCEVDQAHGNPTPNR